MRERPFASDRAATPAVGKSLEIAIVVLFIGLVSTAFYGGLVPDYRTAAGAELGDRVLTTAVERVERAIPPNETTVVHESRVDLPATIRGAGYWILADNTSLTLRHPNDAIGGRTPLSLPRSVVRVDGRWSSYQPTHIAIRGSSHGLLVRLEEGE